MSTKALDRLSDAPVRLEVTPITGIVGAEVAGIDMTKVYGDDVIEQIRSLIDQHKVLVFRQQFDVGPQELTRFAEQFGESEVAIHPQMPNYPGTPAVKVFRSKGIITSGLEDTWHTDGATREQTRWLSFLQGVDIPPYGRDTVFADMEAVFDGLSPKLQEFLAGSTSLHSWGRAKPDVPPISHPTVAINPATGRRALYVNRGYTIAIEGLKQKESDLLLEFLFQQVYIPEYHVRVSWKPGTIVVWDNQNTQHYVVQDSDYDRCMHRVMIKVE